MKYRGVEYRILENDTKKKYKVEAKIKAVGIDRYVPLCVNFYYPYLYYVFSKPTDDLHQAVFDSCERAKQAATDTIDYTVEDEWEECEC